MSLRPEQILPLEIWDIIANHTNIRTQLNLSLTCKQLYHRNKEVIRSYRLKTWGYRQSDIPKEGIWVIRESGIYRFRESIILDVDKFMIESTAEEIVFDFLNYRLLLLGNNGLMSVDPGNSRREPVFILAREPCKVTLLNFHLQSSIRIFDNYITVSKQSKYTEIVEGPGLPIPQ